MSHDILYNNETILSFRLESSAYYDFTDGDGSLYPYLSEHDHSEGLKLSSADSSSISRACLDMMKMEIRPPEIRISELAWP